MIDLAALRLVADDIAHAADLAQRDEHHPVTHFDARLWAERIDALITPDEERAALARVWPTFPNAR